MGSGRSAGVSHHHQTTRQQPPETVEDGLMHGRLRGYNDGASGAGWVVSASLAAASQNDACQAPSQSRRPPDAAATALPY
jgi:hypothetical protein